MNQRRPKSLVLALDLGSSSVRTALFGQDGVRLADTLASRSYAIAYSADGAAELDPAVLLRATRLCITETLRARAASRALAEVPIIAVSGSGFWHGLLGLDRHGCAVTPVFTWADSRSKRDASQLRGELGERAIQLRTGCMLRAQFWPAKLRWLRRTERQLFHRVTEWTSPASWIFGELFGVSESSHSMASATGLYNLREQTWDREMCRLCGVRAEQLGAISDLGIAPKGIGGSPETAIFTAIGDGAASNLGSGADGPGSFAINLGTSGAVRVVMDMRRHDLPRGLFQYVVDSQRVVIGGAISNAGNLHQWCERELRLPDGHGEQALSRTAAAADRLVALPFWVDERAPTWPENTHGTITGVTPTTTAADLMRATTTSTFYRLAAILDALAHLSAVKQIIVSGGILHSAAALHILADCVGRDIQVCRELESSLRGAAIHALEQLGQTPAPLRAGRMVRHDRALAAKHRYRRHRQEALEDLFESAAAIPAREGRSPRQAR